jgi:hypothetical protein
MKTRSITICAMLLAFGALSAQTKQFSLGVDLALPLGDFANEYSFGVGPTAVFELPLGDKLAVTLHAGYNILLVQSDFSEVLESASLLPIQAGVKYFFQEPQKGIYVHAQVGTHLFTEKFKANDLFGREEESETSTHFSWGLGVGYQLAKFDLGLRYNMVMPKDEEDGGENDPLSYIGLRIAYLIPLGK